MWFLQESQQAFVQNWQADPKILMEMQNGQNNLRLRPKLSFLSEGGEEGR